MRRKCLLLGVAVLYGGAASQRPSAADVQSILDLLAGPLPATSFKPPLPPRYADWTAEQRAKVPGQMGGRCGVAWAMMNAGGKIVLLPPELEDETNPLIAAICVTGKMPPDWPLRAQTIEKAHVILQRAISLGEPLHLPEPLTH